MRFSDLSGMTASFCIVNFLLQVFYQTLSGYVFDMLRSVYADVSIKSPGVWKRIKNRGKVLTVIERQEQEVRVHEE